MNGIMGRIMEFMRGRYGMDKLGFALMISSFLIEFLGKILMMPIIYYVGLALFIFMIFRVLSRNIQKRRAENERFTILFNRFRNWRYFRNQRKAGRQYTSYSGGNQSGRSQYKSDSTVHCIYYCPSCKQQVRLPSGKGQIRVTCPRCKEKFDMNT